VKIRNSDHIYDYIASTTTKSQNLTLFCTLTVVLLPHSVMLAPISNGSVLHLFLSVSKL